MPISAARLAEAKTHWPVIAASALLAGVMVVGAGYGIKALIVYQGMQQREAEFTSRQQRIRDAVEHAVNDRVVPTNAPAPTLAPDFTQDWPTYEEANFAFKYPPSLFLKKVEGAQVTSGATVFHLLPYEGATKTCAKHATLEQYECDDYVYKVIIREPLPLSGEVTNLAKNYDSSYESPHAIRFSAHPMYWRLMPEGALSDVGFTAYAKYRGMVYQVAIYEPSLERDGTPLWQNPDALGMLASYAPDELWGATYTQDDLDTVTNLIRENRPDLRDSAIDALFIEQYTPELSIAFWLYDANAETDYFWLFIRKDGSTWQVVEPGDDIFCTSIRQGVESGDVYLPSANYYGYERECLE